VHAEEDTRQERAQTKQLIREARIAASKAEAIAANVKRITELYRERLEGRRDK
jgi:hypothetical protein